MKLLNCIENAALFQPSHAVQWRFNAVAFKGSDSHVLTVTAHGFDPWMIQNNHWYFIKSCLSKIDNTNVSDWHLWCHMSYGKQCNVLTFDEDRISLYNTCFVHCRRTYLWKCFALCLSDRTRRRYLYLVTFFCCPYSFQCSLVPKIIPLTVKLGNAACVWNDHWFLCLPPCTLSSPPNPRATTQPTTIHRLFFTTFALWGRPDVRKRRRAFVDKPINWAGCPG